jgi:predicted DNA-binding protein (MmcQ/YjbR family)
VTRGELIRAALAFESAIEAYPFGDDLLTVKVGGKVFAWIPLSDSGWLGTGRRMAVKAPTDVVLELRASYPDAVHAARPLSERHWVAVHLGGAVPDDEVRELLAASYDAVVATLPMRRRPGSRRP